MTEGHLLIIDDKLARKMAKLQSLTVTGTAGILLKAKKENYIAEAKPILYRIRNAGFFLSKKVYANILDLADENS
jgi:predicted nucleic acid-binding protein